MKRALDVALAIGALAIVGPVVLLLALAVRLTSPGPAFYVQARVGKDRRTIRVVKLRTMVADADRTGPHVTAAGDTRITPVGRLLRATKLDELPQIWNVLAGDMSWVGPRPEAERYAARYRPEWQAIFSVRPGITDEASLAFRDEESLFEGVDDRERAYCEAILPAKVPLALASITRSSLAHDLTLLAHTAAAVLGFGRRAPHPAVEEARRAVAVFAGRGEKGMKP